MGCGEISLAGFQRGSPCKTVPGRAFFTSSSQGNKGNMKVIGENIQQR
jgi:hypothetical protein